MSVYLLEIADNCRQALIGVYEDLLPPTLGRAPGILIQAELLKRKRYTGIEYNETGFQTDGFLKLTTTDPLSRGDIGMLLTTKFEGFGLPTVNLVAVIDVTDANDHKVHLADQFQDSYT